MADRREGVGTFGLVLAVVPWLLLPFAGFFLFFGDGPRDGSPDPRDQVVPWYLAGTGLLALVGLVLGVARGGSRRARMIVTLVIGGGWVAIASWMLVMILRR